MADVDHGFFERQGSGHMDYVTLLHKRHRIHTDRIVLTHMSERMLGHLDEVEFETASDAAVIAL
jgi:hypothetical protein